RESGRFDLTGAALLSLALVAAAWGLNRIDAGDSLASLATLEVWPFLLIAAGAAPLFWVVEKRAADPILHPALFRSLPLRAVGAIAVAAGLVEAGMVFLPAMAVAAFDVEAANASLMMLPLVLTL